MIRPSKAFHRVSHAAGETAREVNIGAHQEASLQCHHLQSKCKDVIMEQRRCSLFSWADLDKLQHQRASIRSQERADCLSQGTCARRSKASAMQHSEALLHHLRTHLQWLCGTGQALHHRRQPVTSGNLHFGCYLAVMFLPAFMIRISGSSQRMAALTIPTCFAVAGLPGSRLLIAAACMTRCDQKYLWRAALAW